MTVAQRYRKKPVVIEAVQWDGTVEAATPIIDWVLNGGGTAVWHDNPPRAHSPACRCDGRGVIPGEGGLRAPAVACPETKPTGGGPDFIAITTDEGVVAAHAGDWVLRGIEGEFYPCRDSVFRATYDKEMI